MFGCSLSKTKPEVFISAAPEVKSFSRDGVWGSSQDGPFAIRLSIVDRRECMVVVFAVSGALTV